jgi:hypothetical protein
MPGLLNSISAVKSKCRCGQRVRISSELSLSKKCPSCGRYLDGYLEPTPNEEIPRAERSREFPFSVLSHIAGLRMPRGNRRAGDEQE